MSANEQIPFSRSPLRTIKVQARDEVFRIVQLQGNLFVCSKAHGNCCCGWMEKGRAPVNLELYEQEWEHRRLRNKLHLSFTGCLGPCAVGNNALLQLNNRSIWFKDLNDDRYIGLIFDYIEALLQDQQAVPPTELADHIFERFLPTVEVTGVSPALVAAPTTTTTTDEASLEGLDPVCLMAVDPTTARWKSEYEGTTFYFCAPACKKTFDREPQVYV